MSSRRKDNAKTSLNCNNIKYKHLDFMGFGVYGMVMTEIASHLENGQDKRSLQTHILKTEGDSQHSPQNRVGVHQMLVYFPAFCEDTWLRGTMC